MKNSEIYNNAGLTEDDRSRMPDYIQGVDEFYGSEAFGKLFDYFYLDLGEMPYGIAKCKTGEPDVWIIDKLSQ